MDSKKKLSLLHSSYSILLVLGIVMLLNAGASFVYLRGDFSRGKIYSISASTKEVLKDLKQPVLFRLFYSKALPSQVEVTKKYIMNLLREYKNAGNARLEFIAVSSDEKSQDAAIASGMLPVRFDVYSKDKFEQTEGFLGLEISYLDKREVMPYLDNISSLEYILTSAVANMAGADRLTLGFITNGGAKNAYRLDNRLVKAVENRYTLSAVDLNVSTSTKGLASLFFIAPDKDLTDKELAALDAYLVQGGSLMALYDTRNNDMAAFLSTSKPNKFLKFLKHNGVEITETFVKDMQSQPIQMERRQGMITSTNIIKYPPFVLAYPLNKQSPVTSGLESLVFPFASPISLTRDGEVLASSSDKSWYDQSETTLKNFIIDPFEKMEISTSSIRGKFPLAVALSGEFKPYFDANKKLKAAHSRLVIATTSKIIEENYNMPESNYIFFLNAIDHLAQDYSLIGIRSKVVGVRPLREIGDGSKNFFRYFNIVFPVVLTGLLGFVFYLRRKSVNKRYKELLTKR